MLRGPADADAFRVKVGRYGDRFYLDNLPACPLAEATTEVWPSVSAVKNAWPKYLTAWAATEVATFAVDNLFTLNKLERGAALALLSKAHERSRDHAAGRGTGVHAILEAEADNKPPPDWAVVDAGEWAAAANLLVKEVQPEWLLSEAVVINRTLGVGGTLDAIWRIDGRNYIVDFKTRKAGKHGAYDDEGAQLGAYGSSNYAIVERDGHAVRVALPELAGGLVVSITPEGYRLFPVDLDGAALLFRDLRQFWQAKQASPIGKPVVLRGDGGGAPTAAVVTAPPKAPAGAAVLQLPINPETLRARVVAIIEAGHANVLVGLWPSDLPTLKQGPLSQDQLARIQALVSRTERECDMPFGPDTANTDLAYALNDFSADEQASLIAEAGRGRPLANFTPDDRRRLVDLITAIDQLAVAFTYEGKTPVLVTK